MTLAARRDLQPANRVLPVSARPRPGRLVTPLA